jgi:hypothetical protein
MAVIKGPQIDVHEHSFDLDIREHVYALNECIPNEHTHERIKTHKEPME